MPFQYMTSSRDDIASPFWELRFVTKIYPNMHMYTSLCSLARHPPKKDMKKSHIMLLLIGILDVVVHVM